MANSHALRNILMGLVLLNILFVQLTDAASLLRLLPLYGLTLASPLLARWRDLRTYRALWNLAVMGVFALLLQNVLSHRLSNVLQDGLILAVMCQVHLLNNLREDQRPDLLFINSFLVAAVTGYLCEDLSFAFAFAAYAPLLGIGLQLLCVAREDGSLDQSVARSVVWDGARRAAAVFVVTLLVFVFWPRDFDRPGLVTAEFDWREQTANLKVGFSEQLNHEQARGPAVASNQVVMRLKLLEQGVRPLPELWRGATLVTTDGHRWSPARGLDGFDGSRPVWKRQGSSWAQPEQNPSGTRVALSLNPRSTPKIFTALRTQALTPRSAAPGLAPHLDGTWSWDTPAAVEYELSLAAPQPLGGETLQEWPQELQRFLQLPDHEAVDMARGMAERALLRSGGDPQFEQVQRLASFLGRNSSYAWPGEPQAAGDLPDFLRGASGHCEYFASAMAIFLRTRGIPCRVVTGYRAPAPISSSQSEIVVRELHAHAWVEVYDPQAGWYPVDPTPAATSTSSFAWAQELRENLEAGWALLTGFDSEQRAALMQRARAALASLLRDGWRWPSTWLSLGLMIGMTWGWKRLQRRRQVPGLREYQVALRRARLQLEPGETPRELLERAAGLESVAPDRLEELRSATAVHEAGRYAA